MKSGPNGALRLFLIVIAAACASPQGAAQESTNAEAPLLGPEGGPQTLYTREAFWFDDLGEMVATADAVVIASTIEIGPGRVITYDDGDELKFTNVVLDIEETWYGDVGESRITLELGRQFSGVVAGRTPRWMEPGSRSLIFLIRRGDALYPFEPINTQGIFRIEKAVGDVIATLEGDELVGRVAAMGLQELRQQVADLASKVEAGEILPQRTLPLR